MENIKFLETEKGKIAYLEEGKGTKVLVFIHGFLGWPLLVREIEVALRGKDYRVVAPYLPGHGQSFRVPKGFIFEDLVRTMGEFVEKIEGEKVLVGHSLGGAVCWQIVTNEKEKISKLVLVNPYLGGVSDKWTKRVWEYFKGARVDKHLFFNPREVTRVIKGGLKNTPKLGQIHRLVPMMETAKVREGLPRGVKVLILGSRGDRLTPRSHYQAFTDKIANKREIMHEGAHHWFTWQSDTFVKEVSEFL